MLFTKEMRDKINNELAIVSEQEPPALSNRQFAFAVTALSNEYKTVPHGGTIALAIAAKYFIEDAFKKGIQIEKEAFDLCPLLCSGCGGYRSDPAGIGGRNAGCV